MTIVTSNSLTLSNVNDGTITHTAYAYSADGTDGFTTVYPNLNLLKNTKLQSYISTGTSTNNSPNLYILDDVVANIINKKLTISYDYEITNVTGTWSGYIRPTYRLGGVNKPVSNNNSKGSDKQTVTLSTMSQTSYVIITNGLPSGAIVTIKNLKVEFGSNTTLWMPSSSEVTTTDWPSFIGQYTDFTQADSTNPSDYTWSLIRGNDGKDGATGPNGAPGKIVSDTEPSTKFVGLTWKYSGITAIDASDGTNIQPNTEYYWNGKNWVINLINAKNIITETLTALGDVTAGSFTLKNGDTGMSVKDGTVKSWGVSKKPDPSVPGGYSNTSVGATLDSGNLIFYSADYNTVSNDGEVIDPAKKAVLLSMDNHNTQSNAVTLVLESARPNFQFLIVGKTVLQGDVTVYGEIRQTSKTASVTIGAGLTLSLERRGEMVIAILIGTINSSLVSGQQFTVGKIPLGYRPNKTVNIPAHMSSSYNGAHIDAGIDGVCTWFGPATSSGYPRGTQTWFTDDASPA